LDTLRIVERPVAPERPAPVDRPAAVERPVEPAMPPESRLAMPVQSLRRWSSAEERPLVSPESRRRPWAARAFVFGGAALLTAYGAFEMYQVVSVSRTTVLQYVLLALFTLNFSWIALAFTSALLGFLTLLRRPALGPPPSRLGSRTAVIMPVYNESTARTFAAVEAIRESVDATGLGKHFDYFILSDSTNPDAWIAEERAFLALRDRLGPDSRVYYRHRPKNVSRKAGNIADWVTRWGGTYAHMLVLDADSLMSGETIVRLAAAMEADPDAGIIQTLPLIINRNTLFARAQQFAARLYGPVIASGLSAWMGRDGNYWGHNAIIRTKAFAAHCGLPDLRGRPPMGGHILSHDFVEAALIRRAGWTVYMLPDLGGSYEESPPSLIDLSARDRRWCQGNLQHARVIGTAGLKLASRQHFATGIMSYLASPFWLFQLVVGIALVLQTSYVRPEYFSQDFRLFPVWPRFDPERALALFAVTIAVLLAPKGFGLLLMLLDRAGRRASGGAIRLALSALIEIVISALTAPILMLIQSGSVFQILLGRDTGWQPQRRDDGSIPTRDIVRRHRWHTALGIPRRHLRLLDRHLALPVDVADDPRPRARDPAVLALGPARHWARPEALGSPDDAGRSAAAADRHPRQRPPGGARATRPGRRRQPRFPSPRPVLARAARGHAAPVEPAPARRDRPGPRARRGEARGGGDHRRGRGLAEAEGADDRSPRPGAPGPPRPAEILPGAGLTTHLRLDRKAERLRRAFFRRVPDPRIKSEGVPLALHPSGKGVAQRPGLLRSLSRTTGTTRSVVEGDPGPSTRSRREAAPPHSSRAYRSARLQGSPDGPRRRLEASTWKSLTVLRSKASANRAK
jgi:membrane glycosyltransferase